MPRTLLLATPRLLRPQSAVRTPLTLQPLRHSSTIPSNYYSLFPRTLPDGPPPHGPFNLDPRALRQEFLRLQQIHHPDLSHHLTAHSSSASPRHKHNSTTTSAILNKAYQTLLNPLARAEYILSLRGIEICEDDKSGGEHQELLMEVLEANMEIEEAGSVDELEEARNRNDNRVRECVEKLEEAFRMDDVDRAKEECVKLRYWESVRRSIDTMVDVKESKVESA